MLALAVSIILGLVFASGFQATQPPAAAVPVVPSQVAATTQARVVDVSEGRDGVFYRVVRVVDGDTIVVDMEGTQEKLRLIGIDTPETVDPRRAVQCFGEEASHEAKRLLEGARVRVVNDASQDTRDKYGRLLAYVFLEDGTFYNEHMIEAGFAHEYTYRVPYQYQKEFRAAEARAESAQRGLWAPDACAKSSAATSSR